MTTPILTEAERREIVGPAGSLAVAEAIEAAVLAKLAAMNEPVAAVRVERGMLGGARRREGMASLADGDYDLYAHPPAAQDREDAERVINAAREAMDKSFEAGNNEADISIPSHLAAALSLALNEYDAAMKDTP